MNRKILLIGIICIISQVKAFWTIPELPQYIGVIHDEDTLVPVVKNPDFLSSVLFYRGSQINEGGNARPE